LNRAPLYGAILAAAVGLLGASPAPSSAPAEANHLTAAQMKALLPKTALHTEYEVAVNKLGQVTGAHAKVQSKDPNFNLQTYGNALQAFIRTDDGHAISGLYRLTYDYDPKTHRIGRTVALIHPGGVNADAEGAADAMIDTAKKEAAAAAAKAKHPSPAPHK
jgi:hypothetical protein